MNLFSKFFLSLVLIAPLERSYAQIKKMDYKNRLGDSLTVINTQEKPDKVKGPKPLTKEMAIGGRLNTDGWGLYFNYGLIKKNEGRKEEIDRFYNVLYFQLELGERYHAKEFRSYANNNVAQPYQNSFLNVFSTEVFKFGKINNFYHAKLGVGYRYLIAGKPELKTIAIHWNTVGGLNLGLVKPYVFRGDGGKLIELDAESADLDRTLASTRFNAGYGIQKGWDKLEVVPGMYLRSGLKFDYANKRKALGGLEVGLGLDAYFSRVHQMALQDAKSVFFNAYAAFELGWKK